MKRKTIQSPGRAGRPGSILVTQKQQRRMRDGILAEMQRYQRCLDLLPNIPVSVVDAGIDLFGDEAAVAVWLCEPARALGGKMPMQVAQSRQGAERVTEILLAISHGVGL